MPRRDPHVQEKALERLIAAGDGLATAFGKSPGWSTRGHEALIAAWEDAKRHTDQEERNEYAKRLKAAVELLERIEQEARWIGSADLERAVEDFTDMMREDGWVQ